MELVREKLERSVERWGREAIDGWVDGGKHEMSVGCRSSKMAWGSVHLGRTHRSRSNSIEDFVPSAERPRSHSIGRPFARHFVSDPRRPVDLLGID